MNNSAGAGQESASTAAAAMIPAELAASTSTRPNADGGDAMCFPGWKCGTLFAVPHLSVIRGLRIRHGDDGIYPKTIRENI